MAGLAAVEPDGARVVDEDGEDGDLGGVGGNGHEAGLDARDVGHDAVDGDAGVGKGGLCYGVVLREESAVSTEDG